MGELQLPSLATWLTPETGRGAPARWEGASASTAESDRGGRKVRPHLGWIGWKGLDPLESFRCWKDPRCLCLSAFLSVLGSSCEKCPDDSPCH